MISPGHVKSEGLKVNCYKFQGHIIGLPTYLQCWWQLWGDISYKSNFMVERAGWMETSCHIQVVLWNRCWIFSFRRTNMCHEIWFLDLWWVPGQKIKIYAFYITQRRIHVYLLSDDELAFNCIFLFSLRLLIDLNGLVNFELHKILSLGEIM